MELVTKSYIHKVLPTEAQVLKNDMLVDLRLHLSSADSSSASRASSGVKYESFISGSKDISPLGIAQVET